MFYKYAKSQTHNKLIQKEIHTMNIKYTPILRWKTGERKCLENLSPEISSQIIPFIEVAPPTVSSTTTDESAYEKKLKKLISSFNISWEDKLFYLYLSASWYADVYNPDEYFDIYRNLFTLIHHPGAIPAFDINDEINISHAASLENTNGICLRIRVNDFESISQTLQDYIDNLWIIPEETDLLLDLTYIDDEIYPKKAALTTAISDIPNLSNYRRIIIASCSFPKDISNLTSNCISERKRAELAIHQISLNLQRNFTFNYVYADYGPMNLNETPYIIGMSPTFKIKYSTEEKYLIYKGLPLKKGGLDLINIVTACKQLINHPLYSGKSFSYGDGIIDSIVNGTNSKGGNLTNWVEYSFNHHITLIVSLM